MYHSFFGFFFLFFSFLKTNLFDEHASYINSLFNKKKIRVNMLFVYFYIMYLNKK